MLNWIKRQFVTATPETLDNIGLEELKREQVRLEQLEKKLFKEIDELEARKGEFFRKGRESNGSVHQQRSIAIKIKSVDGEVKMTDRKLRTISKQLQAVNNFIYLKQSKRELEQSGLFGMINRMDLSELETWIERTSIDGQLNVEKLDEMLHRIHGSSDLADDIEEDAEIANIMAMLQQDDGEFAGFEEMEGGRVPEFVPA